MKKIAVFAVLMVLLMSMGIAKADSITKSGSYGPENTNFTNRLLQVEKFDGPGVLTQVLLEFTGSISTSGTAYNPDDEESDTISLSFNGTVSLDVPGNPPPLVVPVSDSQTYTVLPLQTITFTLAGGAGTATVSEEMTNIEPFIGVCGETAYVDMLLSAQAVTLTGASGNTQIIWETVAAGDVLVTYEYDPYVCEVTIDKTINGDDGLCLPVDTPLNYSFFVRNEGNVDVNFVINDTELGDGIAAGFLAPGSEATIPITSGNALPGEHPDTATILATGSCGVECQASDGSSYIGYDCNIDITKYVNGVDANTLAEAVEVGVGDLVTFTYKVTNGSNTEVTFEVTDDIYGLICAGTLPPDGSTTCEKTVTAEEGEHGNIGTVTAVITGPCAAECSASDPGWYVAIPPGGQGCTPGYWKNHEEDWVGFSPGQPLGSVFTIPPLSDKKGNPVNLSGYTLMDGLEFGGGPGVSDAAKILMRAAVAALLNASHPGIAYAIPFPGGVIGAVNGALATADRGIILDLASELDDYNNAGCFDDMEMPD